MLLVWKEHSISVQFEIFQITCFNCHLYFPQSHHGTHISPEVRSTERSKAGKIELLLTFEFNEYQNMVYFPVQHQSFSSICNHSLKTVSPRAKMYLNSWRAKPSSSAHHSILQSQIHDAIGFTTRLYPSGMNISPTFAYSYRQTSKITQNWGHHARSEWQWLFWVWRTRETQEHTT